MRLTTTLLVLLPLAARAQTAAPAEPPPPRYFMGAGVLSSSFQRFGATASTRSLTLPLQLTLGYQLRPRWAAQLGLSYSSLTSSAFNVFTLVDASGNQYPFESTFSSTDRRVAVAALGRYTLTRRLSRRVRVDVLGGLTYGRGRFQSQNGFRFIGPVPPQQPPSGSRDTQTSFNDWQLGLGPAVRCRLVGGLEAYLDLLVNGRLAGEFSTAANLTSTTMLGLRYRFGSDQ